jgi:uncharacterized protein (DUF849 family)
MTSDKLIINAALTGMIPGKADSPHVPISAAEIAADARRCCDAGASILHLHARDDAGEPGCRREIYAEILQRVRELCPEAILCVSTSGRVHKRFEERSDVLGIDGPVRPEMASLTLGSMNFARHESVNAPEMIKALALRMKERRIRPELEIFELGMAEYASYLAKQGVLTGPFYANILLGSLGTMGASAMNLAMVVRALPEGTIWAGAGIGRFQWQTHVLAVAMGGHVRVGLEDNLWLDDQRRQLATNAQMVERVVTLARAVGRPVASAGDARALLGLAELREEVHGGEIAKKR